MVVPVCPTRKNKPFPVPANSLGLETDVKLKKVVRTEFYRQIHVIHYLTREFRVKLHAKTDAKTVYKQKAEEKTWRKFSVFTYVVGQILLGSGDQDPLYEARK